MQIVINGVGGQGVLFLSKLLSKTAVNKGLKIQSSETIGMAQRGGSVISFLKIGEKYFSPMVLPGTADILICLNENELENGKQFVKKDGSIFVNSDEFFNATELALKNNIPTMTNIIFLGYISKNKKFPFTRKDIGKILPKKLKQCFTLGHNAV